jgi:hypothetical protein
MLMVGMVVVMVLDGTLSAALDGILVVVSD